MGVLTITYFGRFQAVIKGEPIASFRTQKVAALLIYLASAPESAHRRESLMNLLWPGMPEQSARANLRQILFLLRQAIPDFEESGDLVPLLIANRDSIRINPQADVNSDIMQFTYLLSEVRSHNHVDLITCQDCSHKLASAVALYQGEFLADFYLDDSNEFEEWAEITRQNYHRKVLDALETLTAYSARRKAYSEARSYAERQLEIDNLRESAYRQLMEILAVSGHRSEALALYENCRRFFAEELNMTPSARTSEMYEKIRSGEINLDDQQERGMRGYELKEEIGSGANGVIYRAVQRAIGREVAVKIIRPRFANAPAFIRRFETEAQMIGRLEHPHIVPLYDYWRESDRAYLVMRLFKGRNLQASLKDGPWKVEQIQNLLDQISPALEAAHQRGIVHRDIKPANILFDEDGNGYLSDFGIAQDLLNDRELSGEGDPYDGLEYISPEQLQDGPTSPQTDIYSLGAVVYEMLTGERPFPGLPRDQVIYHHLKVPIPLVSKSRDDLPSQVDDVIQRATSKLPGERFASVLEFSKAFRSACRGLHKEEVGDSLLDFTESLYNPYKGLRSFQEVDAGDFFGRERTISQLVKRLEGSRFLAVVGPSGSGKSSVVKAGLVPALRQGALPGSDNWYIAQMVPGLHPLRELELALLPLAVDPPASLVAPMERDKQGLLRMVRRILPEGEDSHLLLVIDQFEELYTMVDDEGNRSLFLKNLLHAINAPRTPLRVVVILRADFYDRPLQYQPLAELFSQNTELLLPLNREELLWAIQEPASQVGVRFEEGLISEILSDVIDQPGALPLVQFALTELFEARKNGLMLRSAYIEMGSVLGAMTSRADAIYESLAPSRQELARQIFLRLVGLNEEAGETRRRVRLTELQQLSLDIVGHDEKAVLSEMLDQFGTARLITFDRDPVSREPTVEVAHEALIRVWSRLSDWLKQSREDIRLQRLLGVAAKDWEQAGQDESFLLHGARLKQFETWQEEVNLTLTPQEREFLKTSLAARVRTEKEEENRRRRELETAQELAESEHQRAMEQTNAASRLRRRAWMLTGALIVTALFGLIALYAGQKALANEVIADRSSAVSQSLALASGAVTALGDHNVDQATSLAVAANQVSNPPAFSQRTLYEVALSSGSTRQIIGGGGWRWSLDVYPESYLAASGADDRRIILWDYRTGEEIRRLEGEHNDSIGAVVFTPDGKYLLSGAYDDWMVLWEVETGRPIQRMFNPTGDVNGLDISPDGRLAVAGTERGIATVWDLQSGIIISELVHNPDVQILPVNFSPDGRLVASGAEDGSVILWEVAKQTPLHRLQVMQGTVFDLAFTPDGKTLAVGGQSDAIWLYSTETGQSLGTLPGHPDWVFSLEFSPDGSLLLAGVRDGAVILWNVPDMRPMHVRYANDGRALNVKFIDQDIGISSTSTGNLRVWSLSDDRLIKSITTSDPLPAMAVTADERMAALGHPGVIELYDMEVNKTVAQINVGDGEVTALAFDENGSKLLSATQAGHSLRPVVVLSLWDTQTKEEILSFNGHTNRIHRLLFSPDGSTFLSASDDKQVILWDVHTGEARFRFTSPTDTSNTVAFSPDGRRMAAGFGTFRFVAGGEYLDNSVRLWDIEKGLELNRFEGHEDAVVSVAFSPDGRYLLSGSIDTTLRLWDIVMGKMVHRFLGHASGVMSVAFSPDGRHAVSGSQDGMLMVWDVEKGDLVRQIKGHQGVVHFVAFTTDGESILSASADGQIKLWNPILSLDHLLSWVNENRFVPELSCEQRLLYGLVLTCNE